MAPALIRDNDTSGLCVACTTDQLGDWVQCDVCDSWLHQKCAGLTAAEVRDIITFHCDTCRPAHGPSAHTRKTDRKRLKYNYAALNDGVMEVEHTHPHVSRFLAHRFKSGPFSVLKGDEIPEKLLSPVIIRRDHKNTLGLSIPPNLTLRRVVSLLGEDRSVPVMNVVTQDIVPGWSLGDWLEYTESEPKSRSQTLNLISLEFTNTKLEQIITRPKFVRDHDLVDKVWPKSELKKPKVRHYCLSSVAGAYTDFHVDFGGSSVFYHVVSGHKTFLMVPPTSANIAAYSRWCLSNDQSKEFFADFVSQCWTLDIAAGETALIPSGWIHAVYTPRDALVIGGNFLTLENLRLQLKIAQVETTTQVPARFRFPKFNTVLWYTLKWLGGLRDQELRQACEAFDVHQLVRYLQSNAETRPKEVGDSLLKEVTLRLDLKEEFQGKR